MTTKQLPKSLGRVTLLGLLLLSLLLPSALAFGIKPAQKSLLFEPYLAYDGQFDIVRDAEGPGTAHISVEGDLAKYISLPLTEIPLSGIAQSIRYSILLPETLQPGTHVGKIIVNEQSEASGVINSQIKITFKVLVTVPGEIPITAEVVRTFVEVNPSASMDIIPSVQLNERSLVLSGLIIVAATLLTYACLILQKR